MNDTDPRLWVAIAAVAKVFEKEEVPCVITSARDGKHMPGSAHYAGKAVDLRSKHLHRDRKEVVLGAMRVVVGLGFDVIFEYRGLENEHFHIEIEEK